MSRPSIKLSKFLSYLLRHGADKEGLSLDEEGFASLDDVWALVERQYPGAFDEDDLKRVLQGDRKGKKRLERQGDRIRAMYGHNRDLQRQITYEEAVPPEYLYHGTTPEAWPTIQQEGLQAMGRQYVHLAIEQRLAHTVASRYTREPVMLRIHARRAHEAGCLFFHPESNHYLAADIPPDFLEAV